MVGHLLTSKEVCAVLRISDSSLLKGVKDNRILPPTKIGGLNRWSQDELMAWIDAGCPDPKKWRESKSAKDAAATIGGDVAAAVAAGKGIS